MAVPTTDPSTVPPTLTAAQTRALLHTLLSTNPDAPRTTRTAARGAAVRAVRQQPIQQQTMTIDVSTRIMGHCNNVALASPSLTEQAASIKQMLRDVLHTHEHGADKAKANVIVNVNFQAGVSIVGSKNVVVFNGKREASQEGVIKSSEVTSDGPSAGRKRRAESEPADVQMALGKKVKVEA